MQLDETNLALKNGGFSPRQLLQDFTTFNVYADEQRAILHHCREYKLPCWMLILGVCGSGKDHLISSIGRALVYCDEVKKLWSGSLTSFLREYRVRAFQSEGFSERDAYEWALSHDLVILRDLGTKDLTPAERAMTIEIFNSCYENRTPVLASANIAPTQFSSYLDLRITDRFAEMSCSLQGKGFVPCRWPSYRPHASPVDPEIERLLTQMPPSAHPSGQVEPVSVCRLHNLPEDLCPEANSMSPDRYRDHRREYHELAYIPTGMDVSEHLRILQEHRQDDARWRELLEAFERDCNNA